MVLSTFVMVHAQTMPNCQLTLTSPHPCCHVWEPGSDLPSKVFRTCFHFFSLCQFHVFRSCVQRSLGTTYVSVPNIIFGVFTYVGTVTNSGYEITILFLRSNILSDYPNFTHFSLAVSNNLHPRV